VGERKDGEKQIQGKILVHQPAAPRAFTTIVFVLNGEDWTEHEKEEEKKGRTEAEQGGRRREENRGEKPRAEREGELKKKPRSRDEEPEKRAKNIHSNIGEKTEKPW
jgi:hypothetical protein